MKRMKTNKLTFFFILAAMQFLVSIFVPFASFAAVAADIPVRVILDSITAVKTSEKSGDELYFDITQYSNQGRAKTNRIPEAPLHWLSKQLPQVKDLILWEGIVHDNEEVKVILSLIEQDTAPWDVDDLIGSALLILENKEGQLKSQWDLPVFEDRVSQEMLAKNNPQYFVMRGDNSEYRVAFKFEENAKISNAVQPSAVQSSDVQPSKSEKK